MPDPFPGMDSYLEAPHLWKGLHNSLITVMMENLQPQVLPRYVAVTEARLLLQPLDQPPAERQVRLRVPDIAVKETLPAATSPEGGAILVAAPPQEATTPVWVDEPELKIWQLYLEIRARDDGSVVTVIEVLSPWNKSAGEGQRDYRDKQRALLLSESNLVEIDLLRGGAHTVAFRADSVPRSDYRICTHRIARSDGFEVIPFSLRDPLPRVGIPLRPGEPDVVLDLPWVLNRVYDIGAYFARVNYASPPEPPLSPEEAAWARSLLRAAGGMSERNEEPV